MPGDVGGGFGNGLHQEILQKLWHGTKTGHQSVGCPLTRRSYWGFSGMNKPCVASKAISGRLTPSWKLLGCLYSLVPFFLSLDFGLFMATSPETPKKDSSAMGKTPHLRTASVAGPQRNLKPRKDTEHLDPAVREPTVAEDGQVQLLTLDQPLPTSAGTQPPLNVAAFVPATRQVFLPAVVQLGAPEPISPLPDVDI